MAAKDIALAGLLLWFICSVGKCTTSASIINKLFADYDKTLRPGDGDGPTLITADLYVSSFGNIQETNMEYKVFGFFRQYWREDRLAGKHNKTVILTGKEIDNMWKPDPFCNNARESNLRETDESISSMVFLEPDGSVLYSRLIIVTAECNMNLRFFPMDEQKCYLKLSSYSYTTENIIYKWKTGKPAVEVGTKDLAQFDLKTVQISNMTDTFVTGDFEAIIVTFTFKRRLGYFIIQVFAPDIFVVMLSWIVFWMDREDMGNRMALGITIILTIMFLLGAINSSMPRVSYPKALDWYLMVSFTFVFFSLVECIIVYCVGVEKRRYKDKEKEEKTWANHHSLSPVDMKLRSRAPTSSPALEEAKANNEISLTSLEKMEANSVKTTSFKSYNIQYEERKRIKRHFTGEWIDLASRLVFPLGFLIYNIGYWYSYLF